jgi:hypothetical protein
MPLDQSLAQLTTATAALNEQWATVRTGWRDEAADRFDAEFMTPLTQFVASTDAAAEEMRSVLRRLHRDCTPPEEL